MGVWPLGWEDPLDEKMTIPPSILAWKIPMDRRVSCSTVHGVIRVRHSWATKQQQLSILPGSKNSFQFSEVLHILINNMANPILWDLQFSSVAQLCLPICDPMDCSGLGLPVRHQLPEIVQTHVHALSDAIQPSHPLWSPSPPACLQLFPASGFFPMSQFFTWSSQSIGASASASVLPMNIQDWFPLGWAGWISKGLSRVSSNTTVQSINSLALSFLYSPTLTSIHDYWKNHSFN